MENATNVKHGTVNTTSSIDTTRKESNFVNQCDRDVKHNTVNNLVEINKAKLVTMSQLTGLSQMSYILMTHLSSLTHRL